MTTNKKVLAAISKETGEVLGIRKMLPRIDKFKAKKIKEESKKKDSKEFGPDCPYCFYGSTPHKLHYGVDLPDSEQGVKDYHKWPLFMVDKDGNVTNLSCRTPFEAYILGASIGFLLGFVTAIILFNSAIINSIN